MKHKITALLLLFIFLFSIIGSHIHFYLQQYIIRLDMSKAIKDKTFSSDAIKVLNYNHCKKDIYWYEYEHEFSYHQKMYDVIYIEKTQNNFTKIVAIEDTQEDTVIFNFVKTSKNKDYIKIIHSIFANFILDLPNFNNFYLSSCICIFFLINNLFVKDIILKLTTPPPENF